MLVQRSGKGAAKNVVISLLVGLVVALNCCCSGIAVGLSTNNNIIVAERDT